MQSKQLALWLTLLLIAVLIIAGCAPRAQGGETAALAGTEDLAIDMPALVIDFEADGTASVGGVPVAQLDDTFAEGALDALVLPADQIAQMTDAGIQHVQISNSPNGLLILVNGQPIPSIKWDGEILTTTAEAAEAVWGQNPNAGKIAAPRDSFWIGSDRPLPPCRRCCRCAYPHGWRNPRGRGI